jgi:N-acyl-phosphatidylethanolamine-hydrolysing phospholipase D
MVAMEKERLTTITWHFSFMGFVCYIILMDYTKSPFGKESHLLTHMLLMTIMNLLAFFIVLSCRAAESPGSNAGSPAHHTSKGFKNLYSDSNRGIGSLLKWQLGLGPHEPPNIPPEEIPSYKPAMAEPDWNRIENPDLHQIQITWVGHSTFLIQMDGVNILTDPIFNDRSSPFSFGGIKRLAPPGIQFQDLPAIDVVLISHNHYDHLDKQTIERLGNKPKYFIPLDLTGWFKKRKIDHPIELDWWQSVSMAGLKFHSVPAQHFSGRSPFDRNKTLWSAWVVEGKTGRIFFAGDTGYSPVFKEIGERFGSMNVSIIPIGAYSPRWFMGPVHVNPPEAIKIHQDTNFQQSIASHWGTFKLSDEPIGEPPLYLEKALKEAGLDKKKFLIMKFGETLSFR